MKRHIAPYGLRLHCTLAARTAPQGDRRLHSFQYQVGLRDLEGFCLPGIGTFVSSCLGRIPMLSRDRYCSDGQSEMAVSGPGRMGRLEGTAQTAVGHLPRGHHRQTGRGPDDPKRPIGDGRTRSWPDVGSLRFGIRGNCSRFRQVGSGANGFRNDADDSNDHVTA